MRALSTKSDQSGAKKAKKKKRKAKKFLMTLALICMSMTILLLATFSYFIGQVREFKQQLSGLATESTIKELIASNEETL